MSAPDRDALVIGVDVGGTKAAVRVETLGGRRLVDAEEPATAWDAEPPSAAAAWLVELVGRAAPLGAAVAAVGIGAQGCNTRSIAAAIERSLEGRGLRAQVVNDAALLVPAAGLEMGFGVVAGTGAIAVGTTAAGEPLSAGGWGWILGDDAGAVGIVREATRSVLGAADAGAPLDPLGRALFDAFGVDDTEHLARAVNDDPRVERWAPHAHRVFSAADAGSGLAVAVIDHAADHLVGLVRDLAVRGGTGSHVVAAGGVVRNQHRLVASFAARLLELDPPVELVVLDDAPVAGAVALARRRAALPVG